MCIRDSYDDGVIGKSTDASHGSETPQNLHAPDEHREHGDAAHGLEQETHNGRRLAQRHRRQVVSGDGPHADPGVHAQCYPVSYTHLDVYKRQEP